MSDFTGNVEIEQRVGMIFHLASAIGVQNGFLVQFEIEKEGCWV
jgi:hypothetical protein